MHRLLAAAAMLLLLAGSLPAAQAGTAEDPEVVDDEGDQATEAGPLVLQPDAFEDVDILAAWVAEDFVDPVGEPGPMFAIMVRTAADIQDEASFSVAFQVERGPTSLPGSTASGEGFTIVWESGAASGIDDADGSAEGAELRLEIPLPSVGASGGDRLTNLTVSSSRSTAGTVMDPVTQDDESGSDEAGPGDPYTFARPAAQPGVRLEILGGSKAGEDGDEVRFTGKEVEADGPDQAFEVAYRITNTGIDADQFAVGASGSAGIGPIPEVAATFSLGPGESDEGTWDFRLDGARANATFTLTATSSGGASGTARLLVVVAPPAPPAGRDVYPAGLDFLTPAAEGTGLDGALGDYAELFLLAIALLLLFILLFLLLAVRRPLPVAAAVPAPPIQPAKAFARHVTGQPAAAAPPPPPGPEARGSVVQPGGVEVEVAHDPPEWDVADKVVTTATVRNRGREPRRLRVALSVDGRRKVEEDVEVQGRASREVRLPWLAGPGPNEASVEVDELGPAEGG